MSTLTITNATKPTPPTPNIEIKNIVRDLSMNSLTFDVHVTNEPFVGYACGIITNNTVNNGQKLASISVNSSPSIHLTPKILSGRPSGAEDRVNVPVNLPIGVYSGDIEIAVATIPERETISCDAVLGFSLTTVIEDAPSNATVTCSLDIIGTG